MGSVGALPYGVNLAEKSCVTRCAFGSNADDLNRAQRLSSHVGKAGVGGTRKPHKYWQGEVGIDVSDVDRPVLSGKDFASDIDDPTPRRHELGQVSSQAGGGDQPCFVLDNHLPACPVDLGTDGSEEPVQLSRVQGCVITMGW